MEIQLDPVEARLLACLIEKSMTTPEFYPLTLNALTAACNQKSNRHPVMHLTEKDVVRSLDDLREHKLASVVKLAGSRTPRYKHRFQEIVAISDQNLAILCELMLRGPQTPGELRTHAGRMTPFPDLEAVLASLRELAGHTEGPLAAVMPPRAGQREDRYTHLLCGPPPEEDELPDPIEPARQAVRMENERLAGLEGRMTALEDGMARLNARFDDFLRQFE